LHSGETLLRVEVAKESQMSSAAVMAREQERIRAEAPTKQSMMRALLFTALGIFSWMAVNWRRAMGIWFGPQPGRLTTVLFCGFLGLNLEGVANRLWDDLRGRAIGWEDGVATVLMGGAVFVLFRSFLRRVEERRRLGIKKATGWLFMVQ
jgi:hypothetical protein